MSKRLQAVRGMNDLLPEDSGLWQDVEAVFRDTLEAYGFREIRTPIVESTALFARSLGEVTDIVEKEMYTFDDRNGDSLTLRPENTAGVVRALVEHGLLHNQTPKVWYVGPMFRHERPQKGRYRQFHQVGVEAFGVPGPDLDAEIICMTARLWRQLGIAEKVTLELNTMGMPADRQRYREALVAYLSGHVDALDADSQRRLHTNPLRILDSKDEGTKAVVADAPRLIDYLGVDCRQHFDALQAMLSEAGVAYVVNPNIVRGMDYYTRTVFEWVTTELGAQGTVCGGGRYDGLVEELGGKPTPGVGFAIGLERLVMLARDGGFAGRNRSPHAFLAAVGDVAERRGLVLAEALRDHLPDLRLALNSGGGSFKSQMKRADRSGAEFALILGEDEVRNGTIGFKPLRGDGPQLALTESQLNEQLGAWLEACRP